MLRHHLPMAHNILLRILELQGSRPLQVRWVWCIPNFVLAGPVQSIHLKMRNKNEKMQTILWMESKLLVHLVLQSSLLYNFLLFTLLNSLFLLKKKIFLAHFGTPSKGPPLYFYTAFLPLQRKLDSRGHIYFMQKMYSKCLEKYQGT